MEEGGETSEANGAEMSDENGCDDEKSKSRRRRRR